MQRLIRARLRVNRAGGPDPERVPRDERVTAKRGRMRPHGTGAGFSLLRALSEDHRAKPRKHFSWTIFAHPIVQRGRLGGVPSGLGRSLVSCCFRLRFSGNDLGSGSDGRGCRDATAEDQRRAFRSPARTVVRPLHRRPAGPEPGASLGGGSYRSSRFQLSALLRPLLRLPHQPHAHRAPPAVRVSAMSFSSCLRSGGLERGSQARQLTTRPRSTGTEVI